MRINNYVHLYIYIYKILQNDKTIDSTNDRFSFIK